MKQNLSFIFVHGLSGWGSYDKAYKKMPYWGMRGGDLMTYLRAGICLPCGFGHPGGKCLGPGL